MIVVRNLRNTQDQIQGPCTLYLYDKAGHRTDKVFELPGESATKSPQFPRLSREAGQYRIDATQNVQLTMQSRRRRGGQ